MNINDLLILMIILACCIVILAILVVILFCRILKYIKTHSLISATPMPDAKPLIQESTGTSQSTIAEGTTTETSIAKCDVVENSSVTEELDTKTTDKTATVEAQPTPLSPISNLFSFMTSFPTEEVDIIQAANDAINALSPFAEAQNIKLHLSTTCEKLMIKAVPESIRVLFRNIIDNSIKYMGRAGHMIITISLLGDDIFVILKDTGKGLDTEETSHIFELNFQGSNRVSGNGLGLTQSKMIVEAFGGTIYAKSSPENGMAIYIQLPVSKKESSEIE